jgi:predicted GNAT family acetyltransferase
MVDDLDVRNNEAEGRYEASIDGELAVVEYKRRGNEISLVHTEVPKVLERRGIGSAMARAALDDARDHGLTVVPLCPFIRTYIRKHPEYLPLVEARDRKRFAKAT